MARLPEGAWTPCELAYVFFRRAAGFDEPGDERVDPFSDMVACERCVRGDCVFVR